jgi:predicted homoserine dehydrogenase-like protein
MRLRRPVQAGRVVSWADVEVDETQEAVRVRKEMEGSFEPA